MNSDTSDNKKQIQDISLLWYLLKTFLKVGFVVLNADSRPQIIPVVVFSWSHVEVCRLEVKMEKKNNEQKIRLWKKRWIFTVFSQFMQKCQKEKAWFLLIKRTMLHLWTICLVCFLLLKKDEFICSNNCNYCQLEIWKPFRSFQVFFSPLLKSWNNVCVARSGFTSCSASAHQLTPERRRAQMCSEQAWRWKWSKAACCWRAWCKEAKSVIISSFDVLSIGSALVHRALTMMENTKRLRCMWCATF